jgi:hypothetical protein
MICFQPHALYLDPKEEKVYSVMMVIYEDVESGRGLF